MGTENIESIVGRCLRDSHHLVEMYSVYGGRELSSRARPKSAILTSSVPVHSRFSGLRSRWK